MPRICQVSGKQTASGNTVSHSHIKTKRKFKVNLVSKKVYLAHEDRWVRLRLSTRMLRTLNHRGVQSLMKRYGQDLSPLKLKKTEASPLSEASPYSPTKNSIATPPPISDATSSSTSKSKTKSSPIPSSKPEKS